MKKFLGVLLSLIMMLSLLPMTTMASDFITKVDLNIEKPVAGEPLEWHKTAKKSNEEFINAPAVGAWQSPWHSPAAHWVSPKS